MVQSSKDNMLNIDANKSSSSYLNITSNISSSITDSTMRNNTKVVSNTTKGGSKSLDRKTLKLFAGVTVLFLISFAPVTLQSFYIVNAFHINYACFINHVSNPIVYFCLDVAFRQEVIRLAAKLKFWK